MLDVSREPLLVEGDWDVGEDCPFFFFGLLLTRWLVFERSLDFAVTDATGGEVTTRVESPGWDEGCAITSEILDMPSPAPRERRSTYLSP